MMAGEIVSSLRERVPPDDPNDPTTFARQRLHAMQRARARSPRHHRQAEQRWAHGPVWRTPPPKPPPMAGVLRFRPSPRTARLQSDETALTLAEAGTQPKLAPRDAAGAVVGACLSSPHPCGASPKEKRAAFRDNIVHGPASEKREAAAPPCTAAAPKNTPSVAVAGPAAEAKAKPKDEGGLAKPSVGFARTKSAWASPVVAPPPGNPDDGDVLAYPPEEAMPLPPPLPLPKSVGGSGHTLTLLSPEGIYGQACHAQAPPSEFPAARATSYCNTQHPAPYDLVLLHSKVRAAAGHHKPDLARATLAASRLRDPDYSLREWHDDLLASLPELRMLHIPESRRSKPTDAPLAMHQGQNTALGSLWYPKGSAPAPPLDAPGGSWWLDTLREMLCHWAQPLLRVLEAVASNAADLAASGHTGASWARARQQTCTGESWAASSLSTGSCASV